MDLSADGGTGRAGRKCTWDGRDGRLLRCRCIDAVYFLLFPGKKMVVFFRTASGALLGQRRAAGRSDVPHPAFWHGL